MKKNSGFTLLELIIVLVVVSVIMLFAIPAMTTFTQNDRLTTNVNTLIGNLALARSEAVKRSQQVSLCVSNNSGSGTPGCTGGNWEDGWIVYVDADNNNSYDAGEEILRSQQALDGSNTLVPTGIGSQVTYDYRGFVTSTGSFLLCDGRSGPYGKTVTITATGRVRGESDSTCP